MTLEFALHGDGPAARWAAQATPGQRATIAGPRGSFIIPLDYDWHLLVGDDTAMPAIARRLEELPRGARAIVILQVPDVADRRSFGSEAAFDVQWVSNTSELVDAVRALVLPVGEGYAWCAGEAAAMPTLRNILVNEKRPRPARHPRGCVLEAGCGGAPRELGRLGVAVVPVRG